MVSNVGMEPDSWLRLSVNCRKVVNLPKEAGMAPDSWLPSSHRRVRAGRFPR